MARGLWKGAISFGLVNVPVELYSAQKLSAELDLTMPYKRDLAPVGYKRVNKATGKEVPWDDVVKGYEYQDDKYVVLSEEDFRRANPEASKTVDILAFVDLHDIAPPYLETPYYLGPAKRVDEDVKVSKTEEITETEKQENAAKGAEVIELMSLLKKSVQGGKKEAAKDHKPKRAARKRRAA